MGTGTGFADNQVSGATKLRLTCRIADDMVTVESNPSGQYERPLFDIDYQLQKKMDRQLHKYAKGGSFDVGADYNKIAVDCPSDTIAVGCGCIGDECIVDSGSAKGRQPNLFCDQKCAYPEGYDCLEDCGREC